MCAKRCSRSRRRLSSDDLSSTSVTERGCQFNFEGSSKMFKEYHQDGCIFECLVEQSFEYVNCTPWNYPFFKENMQTCNGLGKEIFEEQMQNPINIHQCQQKCPQECSKTLYASFVSSETFDIDGLCKGKYDYFKPKDIQDLQPNGIIRSYEEMVIGGEHLSSHEFCKEALKRFAIVRVRMVSNTVTSIKRSQRVTITGHIANIGGTLGLFTGMSIMSFFELFFWLCRFCKLMKKHCNKHKANNRKRSHATQ